MMNATIHTFEGGIPYHPIVSMDWEGYNLGVGKKTLAINNPMFAQKYKEGQAFKVHVLGRQNLLFHFMGDAEYYGILGLSEDEMQTLINDGKFNITLFKNLGIDGEEVMGGFECRLELGKS